MTLMNLAGRAVARLALAVARPGCPVLVVVGAGNNGGDGWVAARHLHTAGLAVRVWEVQAARAADASQARAAAIAAGVHVLSVPPWPKEALDQPLLGLLAQHGLLVIDALLGLGAREPLQAPIGRAIDWINETAAKAPNTQVLSVDLPSGLHPDTGACLQSVQGQACTVQAHHTLSLLTLKPGLFTHDGRDAAGQVWWDDLGTPTADSKAEPMARLVPSSLLSRLRAARVQANGAPRQGGHKGTHGDVWLVGGAPGMRGALHLAARAAVAAGGGRVHRVEVNGERAPLPAEPTVEAGSIEPQAGLDEMAPEVMTRAWSALSAALSTTTRSSRPVVVAGCGGAQHITRHLPELLHRAPRLVLDADALNALAANPMLWARVQARRARGLLTVLTPHPLEAARLLGCSTAEVQAHRLRAAQALADRSHATVVLKGAGSIIATEGWTPWLNDSGNARLATGGTGDVLAGWIGGAWAGLTVKRSGAVLWAEDAMAPDAAALHDLVAACVHLHGLAAERTGRTIAGHHIADHHIAGCTVPMSGFCETAVLPASALIGEMARELMRTAHGHQG